MSKGSNFRFMYMISAITCAENNQRLSDLNQDIEVKTILNIYDSLKRAFACLPMTSLRFYVIVVRMLTRVMILNAFMSRL